MRCQVEDRRPYSSLLAFSAHSQSFRAWAGGPSYILRKLSSSSLTWLKNVQAKEDNANPAGLSLTILASTGTEKMKKPLTY